jgi:putative membrane protein
MKSVILFLKGIVIGIANVIPGVSTATFMVLLRVYDEIVDAVGNFVSDFLSGRKKFKAYLLLLVPFGVGAVVGTLGFAKLATFVLDRFPIPAQFFFIGLIAGSIPSVIRMHHDMKPTVGRLAAGIVGLVVAVLVGLGVKGEALGQLAAEPSSIPGLLYFGIVGFFAGGSVMTPGLSGSYIFLLAGTYEPIMEALDSLTHPPIMWGVIISTAIGVALGVVIFAKVISLLLKKQPAVTFYAILGLIFGSFVGLWPAEFDFTAASLLSMLALIPGAAIAYVLGRRSPESEAEQVAE